MSLLGANATPAIVGTVVGESVLRYRAIVRVRIPNRKAKFEKRRATYVPGGMRHRQRRKADVGSRQASALT